MCLCNGHACMYVSMYIHLYVLCVCVHVCVRGEGSRADALVSSAVLSCQHVCRSRGEAASGSTVKYC